MTRRIHIAINVTDLPKSVAFYRAFLGAEPVRDLPEFAKFVLDEPNLNLALSLGDPAVQPEVLSHLGFQVESTDEVRAYAQRWREAGIRVTEGESVVAHDYKIWAYDPDGNEWEVFSE